MREHTITLENESDDRALDHAHELGEHGGRIEAIEKRLDSAPWQPEIERIASELRSEISTALSAANQAPNHVESKVDEALHKAEEALEKIEDQAEEETIGEAHHAPPPEPINPETEPEQAEVQEHPIRRFGKWLLG